MATTTVTVAGMLGEQARRAVFTSLAALPAIRTADVRLGTVTVEHDGTVTVESLREAIALAGFTVTGGATARTLPIALTTGEDV